MQHDPPTPIRYSPASFVRLYRWFLVSWILTVVSTFAAVATTLVMVFSIASDQGEFPLVPFLLVMSMHALIIPAAIVSLVMICKLLYRSWNQIQDGQARTTPDIAVGFLFIPYFNLYWIFVAAWGLSKDLACYLEEREITGDRVNTNIVLAACITTCATMLPIINIVVLLAYVPLWLLAINEINKASIAIAESGV